MKHQKSLLIIIVTMLMVIYHSEVFAQNVQKASVISEATYVANYMEEYRTLPENVTIDSHAITTSQFLHLLATCIDDIYYSKNQDNFEIDNTIINCVEPYPAISFNDDFYKTPQSKTTYISFVKEIIEHYETSNLTPNYFTFQGAQIRFCASVHYLSSIVRFYDFFGFLPKSMDIKVISPKNLVPQDWATPEDLLEYTSGITFHINVPDNVYYRHNVIDYNTFKLAKDIAPDSCSLRNAIVKIYNWVKYQTWLFHGYGQTAHTPFGNPGLRSAREAWSMRLSTSGGHNDKMISLMRAAGIPTYLFYVYYIDGWYNADVHDPILGPPWLDDDGELYDGFEDSPWPSKSEDFIQEIEYLVNYSRSHSGSYQAMKGLFINASDLTTYGSDYIINNAKAGEFDTIVINIRSAYGHVFCDADVTLPQEFNDARIITNLDQLFTKAHEKGIEVHLGVNILADYLTAKQHRFDNPTWAQMGPDSLINDYQSAMICPCVTEYREITKVFIENLLNRYPADGIVIMDLRWLTDRMIYNPRCDPYKTTGDYWWRQILTDYLQDLVTTIHGVSQDVNISFLSTSLGLGASYKESFKGQNFQQLSLLVDNFIFNINGHYWLTDNGYDWTDTFRYDFEDLVNDLRAQSNTPISITFN